MRGKWLKGIDGVSSQGDRYSGKMENYFCLLLWGSIPPTHY